MYQTNAGEHSATRGCRFQVDPFSFTTLSSSQLKTCTVDITVDNQTYTKMQKKRIEDVQDLVLSSRLRNIYNSLSPKSPMSSSPSAVSQTWLLWAKRILETSTDKWLFHHLHKIRCETILILLPFSNVPLDEVRTYFLHEQCSVFWCGKVSRLIEVKVLERG